MIQTKTANILVFLMLTLSAFGNNTTNVKRDVYLANSTKDLSLMKSYITIQVLKELVYLDQKYFDDSNLNPFISTLNIHLKKDKAHSLAVYTDDIVQTIISSINAGEDYNLISDKLIEAYHAGQLVEIKTLNKVVSSN